MLRGFFINSVSTRCAVGRGRRPDTFFLHTTTSSTVLSFIPTLFFLLVSSTAEFTPSAGPFVANRRTMRRVRYCSAWASLNTSSLLTHNTTLSASLRSGSSKATASAEKRGTGGGADDGEEEEEDDNGEGAEEDEVEEVMGEK